MASQSDFFEHRQEWSRWKHEILRRYLPKFAGILGTWHSLIHYVDGFAGEGAYGDDPPVPGSPLIAARLAAEIKGSARWKYELRCINVEPNRRRYTRLCTCTAEFAPPLVRNMKGTFRDRLPAILETVARDPALFFLDPFGYKGMEWDTIARLSERSRQSKTELLINFNVSKVDRDAGWVDSDEQPAARAFVASLNALMGTSAWKHVYYPSMPKDERLAHLTNFYAQQLAVTFQGIVASYPVRTSGGRLKYHLLFVTANERGCREMGDVVFRVNEDYISERAQAEAAAGYQHSLFEVLNPPLSAAEVEAEDVRRLAEDIYTLGKSAGHLSFGRIQDRLAAAWFGEVVEKHFRAACKLLIQQGRIDREKETGIDERTVLRFV